MDTKPVERKYALTKIKAGDWLLVGNDGKTLWRIATYEDGESFGLQGVPDKTLWGVWKLSRAGAEIPDWEELEDWNSWAMDDGSLTSREAAIQSALRSELPRPARPPKGSVQDAIRAMVAS